MYDWENYFVEIGCKQANLLLIFNCTAVKIKVRTLCKSNNKWLWVIIYIVINKSLSNEEFTLLMIFENYFKLHFSFILREFSNLIV